MGGWTAVIFVIMARCLNVLTSSAIGSASSYWFSELAGTSSNFTKALIVFIVSKFYLLYLEATTRTRSNQCDLLPYIVSQCTYHVLGRTL